MEPRGESENRGRTVRTEASIWQGLSALVDEHQNPNQYETQF